MIEDNPITVQRKKRFFIIHSSQDAELVEV